MNKKGFIGELAALITGFLIGTFFGQRIIQIVMGWITK